MQQEALKDEKTDWESPCKSHFVFVLNH